MIESLDPGFPGMIHLILGQQVSIEAADAMYAGLKALGPVTPDVILSLDDATLRSRGFTRLKAEYARALAGAVRAGLDLIAVGELDSDTAITELTKVRGVGRWTAECYLLFSAGHRDVFPAGDLALRVGWQEIARLEAPPAEDELRAFAAAWAPRRSAAAHLIWHHYLRTRNRR
ncbi:MAG TPA: DNA-3-methyladenine glycosylase 2 family protein [Thermoleophilia bacterium]|nr:DNA-3-methyladenine glycosylase 2 family protein [Thermoleophilia bacterium]